MRAISRINGPPRAVLQRFPSFGVDPSAIPLCWYFDVSRVETASRAAQKTTTARYEVRAVQGKQPHRWSQRIADSGRTFARMRSAQNCWSCGVYSWFSFRCSDVGGRWHVDHCAEMTLKFEIDKVDDTKRSRSSRIEDHWFEDADALKVVRLALDVGLQFWQTIR